MTVLVVLVGLLVSALGACGLVSPQRLLHLVTRAQSRLGLYFIAGFRLLTGAALLLAAPTSRAPLYLQILGVVSLLSGAVTPFFGVARFEAILDWWRRQASWLVRVWSVVALALGLSLVWAVLPTERPL